MTCNISILNYKLYIVDYTKIFGSYFPKMSEYVGDTEDFINIMLDDKQNQLLQMGVMLSTANMIINAGIVVVGLFGMNITISLFDGGPSTKFLETTLGTLGSCVALYLIAFVWGKKKKLLGS